MHSNDSARCPSLVGTRCSTLLPPLVAQDCRLARPRIMLRAALVTFAIDTPERNGRQHDNVAVPGFEACDNSVGTLADMLVRQNTRRLLYQAVVAREHETRTLRGRATLVSRRFAPWCRRARSGPATKRPFEALVAKRRAFREYRLRRSGRLRGRCRSVPCGPA